MSSIGWPSGGGVEGSAVIMVGDEESTRRRPSIAVVERQARPFWIR
jgi:hypothetical protein